MRLFYRIAQWLFPPKCVLCRQILEKDETDLCRHCRVHAPAAPMSHKKIPHLDRWTAVWYYEDKVRLSILRFKFYNARSYARAYGRFLAMQLLKDDMADFDLLTWVPVSKLRRLKRGYDQVADISLYTEIITGNDKYFLSLCSLIEFISILLKSLYEKIEGSVGFYALISK